MDNPKYRPVNDKELIQYIERECKEELERIQYYEEDARERRELLPGYLYGRKSELERILNTIENREYIRKEIE